MARKTKQKPRFRNLAALISALAEGAITKDDVEQHLVAVRMGIGLSKRDKALGLALEGENAAEDENNPAFWRGWQKGMVEGYEGARADAGAGVELRPIADLAAEAQAEAEGTKH